jgi:ADP-ribose pyrophosphatase YjhB (NUDIX family)
MTSRLDARQTALVDVRIMILRGADTLMIQRADTIFPGYWNLPGGHARPGECAPCAAARELCEEVGVFTTRESLSCIGVSHYRPPTRVEKISFSFVASTWTGKPRLVAPDRVSTVGWFAITNPPAPIMPQAAEALRILRTGERFSSYGLGCSHAAS